MVDVVPIVEAKNSVYILEKKKEDSALTCGVRYRS